MAKRSTRQRRLWFMTAILVAMLGAVLLLPFTGYLLDGDSGTALAAERSDPGFDKTNPRSETWREARQGVKGTTSFEGVDRGVLIQSEGQLWRELRNTTVTYGMAWVMGIVLLALLVFHLVFGRARLEKETGRTILRWPGFDRFVHWWVAITFIIMAVTGLSLLYGRAVLIPVMGKQAFGAFAEVAKPIHNYTSPVFAVGLAIMLLMWIPQNFIKSHDIRWFREGGGYLKKGVHPPADFVNAGEKLWFWLLFVGGITIVVSGFYLLFPNFGFDRQTMQTADVVHAVSSIGILAIAFGHVYLGTLGNEGTFGGMINGRVDEGWAKQHHELWYDEVVKGHARPDTAKPPEKTLEQPT